MGCYEGEELLRRLDCWLLNWEAAPSGQQVASIWPRASRSAVVAESDQVTLMVIQAVAYRHQVASRGGLHSCGGLSDLDRLVVELTAMRWSP